MAIALAAFASRQTTAAPPATATPAATTTAATRPVVENYDDGKPRARYATDDKGVKTGAYEELFPTGAVRVRGTYVDGLKDGVWRTFDDAGKVVEQAAYKKDVLDGPSSWTGPDGKSGYRASYRLGGVAGSVTVLDEKGRTARLLKYPRPLDKVKEMWNTLYPKEVGEPVFIEEAVGRPPYKAGRIAPEPLDQALKLAKLYRYLSGVPWQQLTLDPKANVKAQHGAVVLTKIGSLTHTPSKPADMDDAFFKVAFEGCNQSNLHQGRSSIVSGLTGFMDDSDPSNVQRLGHRMWVLKPGLQRVGFGFAYEEKSPQESAPARRRPRGFTAMHVVDGTRAVPEFDYVPFPGEGYFPLPLVGAHYAWSVQLHPGKYAVPSMSDVKVSVKRLDEHFQFDASSAAIQVELISVLDQANKSGPVVIFRPALKPPMTAGRFWVEIAGLKGVRNDAKTVGYVVDVIELPGEPVKP